MKWNDKQWRTSSEDRARSKAVGPSLPQGAGSEGAMGDVTSDDARLPSLLIATGCDSSCGPYAAYSGARGIIGLFC